MMLPSFSTLSRPVLTRRLLPSLLSVALFGTLAGCSNGDTAPTNEATTQTQTDSGTKNSDAKSSDTKAAAGSDADVVKALQANLAASGLNETIVSATPTSMDGVYWVNAEGLPGFFTDKSGKHIIQGQIVSVGDGDPVDISAEFVANDAKAALATVDEKDMIIYPATGETKAAIYVFTDADCGYCRQLHSEMDDINARGIEVRYLAWPRSEQSIPKMDAIWCSEDRKAAMNQAKTGAEVAGPDCQTPVAQQLALGKSLGVRGTPAIFTEAGAQIGGYLPAAELAQAAIAN
ncbi:DsbC family protein [Psychrobacter aestuarii]|uniref:Thiol:disulfide interchange protein n=2 Tax=Psychrobacter aestuarii TaxID=556327 RepID=A0ABN0VKA0_9GAMM